MKKISYFPGCTLTNTAKNFDLSARESTKKLGFELEELPRWNCCGTVYSLASDNLMNHLAPIRLLKYARDKGHDRLTTLCSMCYNTLKRSNKFVTDDRTKLDKINKFMEDDKDSKDYNGEVEVIHVLEILRDDVGFSNIKSKVIKPLKDLKVVSYYGCLLTRPKDIAIDDMENPVIMDNLMSSLGAESLYDPYLTECCGSYHTLTNKEVVVDKAYKILKSAERRGADVIITSCPLCHFNLDERQKQIADKYEDFEKIPVLYFTQLLAIALGLDEKICNFDIHFFDPRPLLKRKELI